MSDAVKLTTTEEDLSGKDVDRSKTTLELGERQFVAVDPAEILGWPCTTTPNQQPTLTIKDNDLFLITDTSGNIGGCVDAHMDGSVGLFCQDTRFLSRLELQINKKAPVFLSSTAQRGFALSVLCSNPHLSDDMGAETIAIQRDIALQGGLLEELTLTNYSTHPVTFELSLSFAADFADLFEIRGRQRPKRGQLMRQDESPNSIVMAYLGVDQILMESRVTFYQQPPKIIEGYTAVWQLTLNDHETICLGYRLEPIINNHKASAVDLPTTLKQAVAAETQEEEHWRDSITRLRTDNHALNMIIERAEKDLYILSQTFGEGNVFSAGVPRFSTLFGRDAIITAMQTLVLNPTMARNTLVILANYQGQIDNQWREEAPGKILHEIRLGEMARCGEIPHTPYYGTVDATPLWLMLYADYYNWTGDQELLEQLWDNALAAMGWIDRSLEPTGYLTYEQSSEGGLRNQGWKDSWPCIVDAQGKLGEGDIALSEVQGYVYATKVRMAKLARQKKRLDLAERWEQEALQLKERFNQDFWLPEQEFYALAIDGSGQVMDSITSNPGHCLGLGILDEAKATKVAQRLQLPDMSSGWGIRTLSSKSPAFNPMGYHIGSIWPHDNSIIATGLRAQGHVTEALEIAQAIIDMTNAQEYSRPPELFCGYDRRPNVSPVRYPVACSPQAWATGAIFQLLHMMVNLIPEATTNCLRIVGPVLPESIQHLSLENLHVGNAVLHLEFERSHKATACRVVSKRGNLKVIIEA
ncbi:amylo-alpha-1,6-glucosidase [Leptothoe sp. PORK10 BA2]|uniref:amylo-alpha-1,6-glucosidase n=1 Tax=Leptothoe sp. PORK10 BA2 TaxID=3110254 RepID=UPI002B218106|nr:amylo-alpha-1,6-glucosidase [Leptothoe sp. PORK10 BA2]MEA5465776.1 amylo-alpha-1,6-glucosidase [Leptothoe sp. PORK10 BA2]